MYHIINISIITHRSPVMDALVWLRSRPQRCWAHRVQALNKSKEFAPNNRNQFNVLPKNTCAHLRTLAQVLISNSGSITQIIVFCRKRARILCNLSVCYENSNRITELMFLSRKNLISTKILFPSFKVRRPDNNMLFRVSASRKTDFIAFAPD